MNILQRPAYLGDSVPTTSFAAGLGVPQPPRISADNGFTLLLANGVPHPSIPPSLFLDVVVIGHNPVASRIYYEGGYDPRNSQPPACYSDNGVGPSSNSMQPQSELCVTCRHSVWDRPTPNGNFVPACDHRKKLACLVAGAGDTVFLLNLPPASLGAWRDYVAYIEGNDSQPFDHVTR